MTQTSSSQKIPQVKWMMYWIVFAFFNAITLFTDVFISWFPGYYLFKTLFIIWLVSPATRVSVHIYIRQFDHPGGSAIYGPAWLSPPHPTGTWSLEKSKYVGLGICSLSAIYFCCNSIISLYLLELTIPC